MISTGNKIIRISSLVGTNYLTEWEEDFVVSICEETNTGTANVESISDKQRTVIDKLYRLYFAS